MSLATNRSLPEAYVYSTDSYYYLLKNDTGVFEDFFWMKRTREKIVTQSLPVYVRNQKRKLVFIKVMPSQTNVSGISA